MTRHAIGPGDLANAIRRGKDRAANEFRAQSVRYRPEDDTIEIITTDKAGFLVPRRWIGPLASIEPQELFRLEVWPGGSAFELPDRDVHVSVHGLLMSALPKMVAKPILAALLPSTRRRANSPGREPQSGSREKGKQVRSAKSLS